MIRRIEVNGSERNRPLLKRFMVGILASAPRYASPGNPIVGLAMRIDLFNDRIVETPAAQTGDSNSGDRPKWPVRNIQIHECFVRQTFFQNQASDTNGIPSSGVEIKMFLPLLRHSH